MRPGAEIEPGPHWWKASALTTRPTLPPRRKQQETIAEKLCKASAEGAQELMKANRELREKVKIDFLHCSEKFATYQC